jgi:hypothetical protein
MQRRLNQIFDYAVYGGGMVVLGATTMTMQAVLAHSVCLTPDSIVISGLFMGVAGLPLMVQLGRTACGSYRASLNRTLNNGSVASLAGASMLGLTLARFV